MIILVHHTLPITISLKQLEVDLKWETGYLEANMNLEIQSDCGHIDGLMMQVIVHHKITANMCIITIKPHIVSCIANPLLSSHSGGPSLAVDSLKPDPV